MLIRFKNMFLICIIFLLTTILFACNNNTNDNADNNDQLKVVTSFTILTDMVEEIGEDLVQVHNLVPTGTDPHEYDPLPEDIKAATDADALFYNGLNLEGGKNGWFAKMMDATNNDWDNTFELTEGVEPKYVSQNEDKEEDINPHAFIDPKVGVIMAKNTMNALIEVDPDNKNIYEKNGEKYIEKLEEIAQTYEDKINDIPQENRILITSEQAYQYMTDRYGLKEGFIWAIDTEENGSPEQIKNILDFIETNRPPVLFVETNVDTRPMETVSKETNIEIFGELYSDELGEKGEEIDSYIKFLEYNIHTIYEGLTSS